MAVTIRSAPRTQSPAAYTPSALVRRVSAHHDGGVATQLDAQSGKRAGVVLDAGKADRHEHDVGLDQLLGHRHWRSHAGLRETGELAPLAAQSLDAPVALDRERRELPLAHAALLVRGVGAQQERPVGPGALRAALARRGRAVCDLGHGDRALAQRVPEAVGTRVSATEHDHPEPAAVQLRAFDLEAGDAAVALREVLHREMHARKIRAGNGKFAVTLRAGREHERVMPLPHRRGGLVHSHRNPAAKLDALGFELGDAPVDHALLELEVGDAVAQQAAGAIVALVHGDGVPGARELLRRGQPGRPRPDHADAAAAHLAGGLRARSSPRARHARRSPTRSP